MLTVLVYTSANAETPNQVRLDDLLASLIRPSGASAAVRLDGQPQMPAPGPPVSQDLPGRDALAAALAAAKRGDSVGAQTAMMGIRDPVARQLAQWAMIDVEGEQLPFATLDGARRDLADWPRAARREAVTEKAIGRSALTPAQVIDWFGAQEPQTAEGALALASADQQTGHGQEAEGLIRRWWRTRVFEADVQRAIFSRFGDSLSPDDHAARMESLLYGPQGPAVQDILPLLPADQRALARTRLALRADEPNAQALVGALPASVAGDPGLAVDDALYLLKTRRGTEALRLAASFPAQPPNSAAASRIWSARRGLIAVALKAGDYATAYSLAARSGLPPGPDYAEAEFYAGWIALRKLHNPAGADLHFANLQGSSSSPITQARAFYWRGRATAAQGDAIGSLEFYSRAARYFTTFYGQLAAAHVGGEHIALGRDPALTPVDRERFEGRDLVQAARLLAALGETDLFRVFVLDLGHVLRTPADCALLVDLAASRGDQDLAMRTVRLAARQGVFLPERGYPIRPFANSSGSAEAAIVFGITRQESGFDARVRSPVGARGMMQLMPVTAKAIARRIGETYRPDMLDDPEDNMRLGAAYIGELLSDFGGSYLMAAAAYNAGPSRPLEWASYCGDPRSPGGDPVDFIECIPFPETRNYVMRVLEATEIYRARLQGGSTTLSLAADLKQGSPEAAQARTGIAEVVDLTTPVAGEPDAAP